MRTWVVLFSITLLLATVGCDSSIVVTNATLTKNAKAYYEADLYDDALRLCDMLCKRQPGEYEPFALRCNIYSSMNNAEAALRDADYLHDLFPHKLDVYRLRASICSSHGKHRQAIEDLQYVIKRTPDSCDNQIKLAHEFEQLGDYSKAIDHLKTALSICDEDSTSWSNFSRILATSKKSEFRRGGPAKKCASRAIKFSETDQERCQAWDSFGAALAESGDFTRAVKAANKALEFTEDAKQIETIEQHIKLYEQQQPVRHQVSSEANEYWKERPNQIGHDAMYSN